MIVQCYFLMISSMLLLNDISMLCELHDLQNDTAIDSVDIIAWYLMINTRRFWNVLRRYESDDIHRTIPLLFTACSNFSLLTELSKISEIWRVLQCPPPTKVPVINTDKKHHFWWLDACSYFLFLRKSELNHVYPGLINHIQILQNRLDLRFI